MFQCAIHNTVERLDEFQQTGTYRLSMLRNGAQQAHPPTAVHGSLVCSGICN